MKLSAAFASIFVLAIAPVSASAAQQRPIRSINYLVDDQYTEIGRFVIYCDGTGELIGEWGRLGGYEEFGCPE